MYAWGALAVGLVTSGALLRPSAHADFGLGAGIGLAAEKNTDENEEEMAERSIKERESGVIFPSRLSPRERLIGASCRLMRQLVKVYAIGLYVDEKDVVAALQKWKRFSSADICGTDPVWEKLCEGSMAKTFRIVVVRQVAGSHMGSGFEHALLPRARAHVARIGGRTPREVRDTVKDFCKAFSQVGTMKLGSIVNIRIQDDRVELVIDERVLRVVTDPCLAWALADMYLGDRSVVSAFRMEISKGLTKLLED